MPVDERTFSQYLSSMGIPSNFLVLEGSTNWKYAIINHMGIPMAFYAGPGIFYVTVFLGYLPRANIAPFYRKLLGLNALLIATYFSVNELDQVYFVAGRNSEGCDLSEFKWTLDTLGANYWQYGQSLINEFALPATR